MNGKPDGKEDIPDSTETTEPDGPRFVTVREGLNRRTRRRKQALSRRDKRTLERREKRARLLVERREKQRLQAIEYSEKGFNIYGISRKMDLTESTVRNLLKEE